MVVSTASTDGVSTGTRWRTHPPASRRSPASTPPPAPAPQMASLPTAKKGAYFLESHNRNANVDKGSTKRIKTCRTEICWNQTSRVPIVDHKGNVSFKMFMSSPRQWFGRKKRKPAAC
jgi:hypothetical protein